MAFGLRSPRSDFSAVCNGRGTSRIRRLYGHFGGRSVLLIWGNYQSAALLVALPSVFNIHEWNTFRPHTKLPAGSMRHHFLQGLDQNVARWNAGGPENCQRCAAQHGSCKRYRRPSAFPNLDEASLRRNDGKFLACYRSQKRFCGRPHT